LIKNWDPNSTPDSKSFVTTFTSADKEIDAVFKLANDGKVSGQWKFKGQPIFQSGSLEAMNADLLMDAKAGRWQSLYITSPVFPAGDYEVDLSVIGGSDAKAMKFSVTDSVTPVPSAKVKLDQTGLTTTYPGGSGPDPKSFATTFKPSDGKIYLFMKPALDSGAAPTWISAAWKYKGDLLGVQSFVVSDTSWKALLLEEPSFPTGDYEVDVSVLGTSETVQLKFSVK
jgi:hypothetical protein